MEKLYQLAKGYTQRFPDGNSPYQIVREFLKNAVKWQAR